jgi:uncharacterized protein (DUF58 family)
MSPGAILAVGLAVAGVLLEAPALAAVGVLLGLVAVLRSLWSRYGLRALAYERHLSSSRVPWGERIELQLVVRNAKPLPLPRLRVDDLVSREADIAGVPLDPSPDSGFAVLAQTWSVGWFERITRRLEIVGSRRGRYRFVRARLQVADLFGESSMVEERPLLTTYRVVPRTVAVRSARADSPIAGTARAPHGLVEEPSLFAGVRPYQPGDQLRRIHWKATARVGRPVSRRFDPAREREVLLALDMQTVPGASWQLTWDEDLVEGLCVAAMSLARAFIADGVAVGLAVNAYSDRPQRTVFLPPSATPTQLARIADYLADVSPYASMPFERLLAGVARRAPMGCAVVALSGRDPSGLLPVLRRLGAQGYRASHAALGPDAARWSARARSFGVPSAAYRLIPDWRTADALERMA